MSIYSPCNPCKFIYIFHGIIYTLYHRIFKSYSPVGLSPYIFCRHPSVPIKNICKSLPQLLQHEDQTIAQLCIDLNTPTYTQSRMWKNNGEKLDIQALQHMASECILAYKSRLLDQEGHQLRQEMSRLYALGEDTTSIEESIQQHDKLRREFGKVTNRLKP